MAGTTVIMAEATTAAVTMAEAITAEDTTAEAITAERIIGTADSIRVLPHAPVFDNELGAYAAPKAAGNGRVIVVGFDGSPNAAASVPKRREQKACDALRARLRSLSPYLHRCSYTHSRHTHFRRRRAASSVSRLGPVQGPVTGSDLQSLP